MGRGSAFVPFSKRHAMGISPHHQNGLHALTHIAQQSLPDPLISAAIPPSDWTRQWTCKITVLFWNKIQPGIIDVCVNHLAARAAHAADSIPEGN